MIHVLGSSLFIYVAVGVVCTVLALLVIAILYLIRVKQSKGKENHVHGREAAASSPFFSSIRALMLKFTAAAPAERGGQSRTRRVFAGCGESSAWCRTKSAQFSLCPKHLMPPRISCSALGKVLHQMKSNF